MKIYIHFKMKFTLISDYEVSKQNQNINTFTLHFGVIFIYIVSKHYSMTLD